MATITAYGAAREVTGSKHLLETDRARILVDCGIFQGSRKKAREKNSGFAFDPKDLHACVNTHGHLDHCGNYPLLTKKGFSGDILSTPATRDISGLIMMDSAKIQAHDARFLRKQQKKDPQPWRKVWDPLYDEKDVKRALAQFVTVDYHRPYPVAPGVTATLYDAGHILGSALVHMEARTAAGTVRIGFTGDLGRKNLPILRDPDTLPPVDYLVCESTYGNRLHDDMVQAERELSEVISETVARGGKVVIPAFAVERTQEVVYILHKLYNEGRIPAVPVYVDSPMAVSATGIFRAHPECFDRETVEDFLSKKEGPFTFDGLRYITKVDESKGINASKDPCIIIATSGMCEAGRVLHHLIHTVEDPKNTILIVGFMAAHTLGRRLADRSEEVRIFGAPFALRARVKILNAFSAHADYREIGAFVTSLDADRLRAVFLVHGESGAQEALREHLLSLGVRRVEILEPEIPAALD